MPGPGPPVRVAFLPSGHPFSALAPLVAMAPVRVRTPHRRSFVGSLSSAGVASHFLLQATGLPLPPSTHLLPPESPRHPVPLRPVLRLSLLASDFCVLRVRRRTAYYPGLTACPVSVPYCRPRFSTWGSGWQRLREPTRAGCVSVWVRWSYPTARLPARTHLHSRIISSYLGLLAIRHPIRVSSLSNLSCRDRRDKQAPQPKSLSTTRNHLLHSRAKPPHPSF